MKGGPNMNLLATPTPLKAQMKDLGISESI